MITILILNQKIMREFPSWFLGPKDILERTAKVAVLEGLSVRRHLMMTAAFISSCGET